MTATAETTELDFVDGPKLETGGTTNINTGADGAEGAESAEGAVLKVLKVLRVLRVLC